METKTRILVVDDDADLCANIQDILEAHGYAVDIAVNGQDALSLCQKREYDLALVDVKLTDISGSEVTDRIAEISRSTEFIYITGYASLDSAIEAVRQERVVSYEIKPLDMDRLVSIIRQITERKRAEEETRLLQTMAQTISESPDYRSALEMALQKVCETTGWSYGEAWLPRSDGAVLECGPTWCSNIESLEKFRQLSQKVTFPPDTGLPGRVWSSKRPEWLQDVSSEPDMVFLRVSIALEAGLKAGFGVPIISDGQVLAVLVFFLFEPRQENTRLVELVSAVAAQLGSVLQRKRAEEALRESEERYRSLFERVPVGLYRTTPEGQILDTNPAAVQILGYPDRETLLAHDPVDLYANAEDRRRWQSLMEDEGTVQGFKVQRRRYDGLLIWVRESARVVRDDEGQILYYEGSLEDITERKRAEEMLEESRAQIERAKQEWEAIADALPQLVCLLDGQRRILRANRTVETWGLAPVTSIKGREVHELFHPGCTDPDCYLDAFWHQAWEELARDRPVECEAEDSVLKRYLYIQARPLSTPADENRDEKHRVATNFAAVVIHDITERKRAEEALRRRNRELALLNRAGHAISSSLELDQVLATLLEEVRHLMDVTACSVWLIKPKTGELVCQQAIGPQNEIVRGWRLAPGEGLAGWVAHNRVSLIVPDTRTDERHNRDVDRQTGLSLCSILSIPMWVKEHVIGVLQVVDTEVGRFDTTDLELLEPLAAAAAIAIENAQLYEETARRLAETRVLQEVMLAAASILDFDQVLTRAIQAIHRALGIEYTSFVFPDESGEYLVVHPSLISVAPLTGEGRRLPVDGSVCGRVYATGQPELIHDVSQISYYFTLAPETASELCVPVQVDGRIIAVLNAESPQLAAFTEDDLHLFEAIAAQLGTVMKNAQLYEAEREQRRLVEQSQLQLVRSEKLAATGRLAASLAHEINNPLQIIHNSLQLMLTLPLGPDKRREYLHMAAGEVERLMDIVIRILDFTRPSQRGKQPTDVNDVVEKVFALARKYLQHRHVIVRRDLSPDLPAAMAVTDELRQVFLNLVLNAVDAMPEGGSLHVTSHLADDGRLAVALSDSGTGIPPEHLDRIFEPFFSTKKGGTGLGLSVSYDTVERHGGEITVQSIVEEGTTFTVWLPALSK